MFSHSKQKLGRWIISSDGYYPYCSKCHYEPKDGKMTETCPNCGIKMVPAYLPYCSD